jgi:hypothetical protein
MSLKQRFPHELHQIKFHAVLCYYIWPAFYLSHEIQYPRFSRQNIILGEQALLIFERKIFRRIYSPKYENDERKIRTNRELEETSKGENIVKWIKGQRIR